MKKLSQAEAVSRVKHICIAKGYKLQKPFSYKTAQTTRLKLKCLHDDHVWECAYYNLVTGNKGCPKCKTKNVALARSISAVAKKRVLRSCKDRNLKLLAFDFTSTKKCVLKLECLKDKHLWTTSYSSFIHSKAGCPKCGVINKAQAQLITAATLEHTVKALCKKQAYTVVQGEYGLGAAQCRLVLKCKKDGYTWSSTYNNFVNHLRGCSVCAKSNPVKLLHVSGTLVPGQGYEHQAMKWLIQKGLVTLKDLTIGRGSVPTISYEFRNKRRTHYPDIFIAKQNRLIEVKGLNTMGLTNHAWFEDAFEQLKAKRVGAIEAGFKYTVMLMDRKGNRLRLPNKWYTMSRLAVARFLSKTTTP